MLQTKPSLQCTTKCNQFVSSKQVNEAPPNISPLSSGLLLDSLSHAMELAEVTEQNHIPSFRTNTNPFSKNSTKPTSSTRSNKECFNSQPRSFEKPNFHQIQNKCLDIEESLLQLPLQSKSSYLENKASQINYTSTANAVQGNYYSQSQVKNDQRQQVIIGRDITQFDGENHSYVSQLGSSSSSEITTTSSCLQWEQVMQNRRNLVTILQDIVLDSNMNIQTPQSNKFQQESIKPSYCSINPNNNLINNSPNNKTQYSVYHNEQLEREWEEEQEKYATPTRLNKINRIIEKDEMDSQKDNSSHLQELEDDFEEKESLYFLKRQHKQSIFGTASTNNINNQKGGIQSMLTKTTMNTINNLSTMTTINQNFSPQINKRNSKSFAPQPPLFLS